MKKQILVIIFLALCIYVKNANAQKVVTSVFQEPYVEVPHYFPQFPIMFYDSAFRAYKDLPFVFLFNDITADVISVHGPSYVNASDFTVFPIVETATFYPFYTYNLIDKSYHTGSTTHQSKLYFWMDTVNAEQIFKIEWKNMGFKNCTANDSLNMQVWIFERTNKVQFRYGKSNLTNPNMLNVTDTTFIGFEVETANKYYYGTFDDVNDSLIYKDMFAWGNVFNIPKEGTVIEIKANETFVNTSAKKLEKSVLLLRDENNIQIKLIDEAITLNRFALYNMNAECIQKSNEEKIDIHNLPAGMYIVKVETNQGVYTEKFLK